MIKFLSEYLFRLEQISHNTYSKGKNITVFIIDGINKREYFLPQRRNVIELFEINYPKNQILSGTNINLQLKGLQRRQ